MCQNSTLRPRKSSRLPVLVLALVASAAFAQTPAVDGAVPQPDWRRIGNSSIELGLAALATGPVVDVWYSEDGSRLFAETESGTIFTTADFGTWVAVSYPADLSSAMADPAPPGAVPPEPGAVLYGVRDQPALAYALGRAVYRSDDGGLSWVDLTEYRGHSILGDDLADMAVAPVDGDEIVVAGANGVWRSLDGGLSWDGLNEALPNLAGRRLLEVPSGGRSARVSAEGVGTLEWAPGERLAWRSVADDPLEWERRFRQTLSDASNLGAEISAVELAGDYIYAGSAAEGLLWVTGDLGLTWRSSRVREAGRIVRIVAVEGADGVALAAATGGEGGTARLLRTVNGGIFWDDITGELPEGAVSGLAADFATGAIYAATDAGVYYSVASMRGSTVPDKWSPVSENLPNRAAEDVALDAEGNQIFVLLDGEGLFGAIAPHRYLDPSLVSGADWTRRGAAPGSLLSILGRRVVAARVGALDVPILAASDTESQIQVPFEASGTALSLALRDSGSAERYNLGVPLDTASPAIFLDRDGTPLLLDADTGVMLDAINAARPGSRVQILATGLGEVEPDWPTGLAAPLENPPEVVAGVRVFVDRVPVEVTKATLAPGYIGFYVVEIRIPDIVNAGPAELVLEAGGNPSNRTRIYLEP